MKAPYLPRFTPIPVVHLDNFDEPTEGQLKESIGVRLVTDDERDQHFYSSNAVVPIDTWHDLTAEIIAYERAQELDTLSAIGWFSLPPPLQETVHQIIDRHHRSRPHEVQFLLRNSNILGTIKQYMVERFSAMGPVKDFGDAGFNSPGIYTVTINRQLGQLAGLHLDSWNGPTLGDKKKLSHRIVLNLGPVPRWFLYAPISLPELVHMIHLVHPDVVLSDDSIIHNIGPTLLYSNPKIKALKLESGQGYIAATESVVHDATTYWADQRSYNFQLMGRFNWLCRNHNDIRK